MLDDTFSSFHTIHKGDRHPARQTLRHVIGCTYAYHRAATM